MSHPKEKKKKTWKLIEKLNDPNHWTSKLLGGIHGFVALVLWILFIIVIILLFEYIIFLHTGRIIVPLWLYGIGSGN